MMNASTPDPIRAVDLPSLVLRWTPDQIENAHRIVNDIAEDIDNNESRRELRMSLAIYADLLSDERERRNTIKSDEMLDHVKRISAHLETQNAPALPAACRTCKHWYEQLEGFGTCGNATNHDLLRVLGGYMLCHETYGCVMHKPNAAGQAITRKETPDTQTDEN